MRSYGGLPMYTLDLRHIAPKEIYPLSDKFRGTSPDGREISFTNYAMMVDHGSPAGSKPYFGISGEDYTWAQPLNESVLEGKNLSVARPVNEGNPIPSCRNADGPYNKNQFVITIDGFVISDNITLVDTNVIDTGFKYSDHNPVYINFILNP